jgi:hypothetical protein
MITHASFESDGEDENRVKAEIEAVKEQHGTVIVVEVQQALKSMSI